jgi:hypothetical protein
MTALHTVILETLKRFPYRNRKQIRLMNCFRRGWLWLATASLLGVLLLVAPSGSTFVGAAVVYAQNVTPQPTASPAPVLFNIYRAATYNLDYPSNWKIVPRSDSETFFGTTPAPACGQPGLLVTLLGAANSKTADILLDDYTAINTYLTPVGNRDDANDLGRFQVFRGPCTDGSTRVLRVAMFVAFGNGYRVTAYAPKAAYAQWDATFQQIASSFNVTADESNSSNAAQPVYAPIHAPDTLLVHVFDGNIFMANVADVPGTPLTRDGALVAAAVHYVNPRIAPDGKRVAFVQLPGGKLYIAPIAKDAAAVATAVSVNPIYPLAWSPDGAEVAYVKADAGQSSVTVQALRLDTSAVRTLSTVPVAACAESASTDPATLQLVSDLNAVNANGDTTLLEWSNAGQMVISNGCTGISLLDIASGKAALVPALSDLKHVVLSPDKSTLVGITTTAAILMTLTDQKSQILPIKADRLAWGSDNRTLYYTTRAVSVAPTPNATATISGTPQTIATISPIITRYDLTIHQYNLLSSQDSTIYSGQGFAISTIAPSPDGSGLLFTLIQNNVALVQPTAGTANSTGNMRQHQPAAQVYWLTLPYQGGQPPTLLIDTFQAVFGPLGSTAVIGLPVTPHAGATNIPGG